MVAKMPDKPPNLQSMFCAMHVVSSTKSNFITFNTKSWERFIHFANEWKRYSCKEREVTLETESKLGLTLNRGLAIQYPNDACLGYHYDCYKRFCDQHKIKRKETSQAKKQTIQGEIFYDDTHKFTNVRSFET